VCIIVDTNTWSSVFDATSEGHAAFRPVREWIMDGDGFVVYGGTTYLKELRASPRILALFTELSRARKASVRNKSEVDAHEKAAKKLEPSTKFDDPHLVAIVRESGCRLICSGDKRAHPYLKRKDLYPSGRKPPKIFTGHKRNDALLCKANIVDSIRPK
jgi:predicted nucleic acid-binding protein